MRKVSKYIGDRIQRRREDFEVQTFRAGGKGGQKQNKVETGVRIIDRSTGVSAESRVHRTQLENRKQAFVMLAERLIKHYEREELEQMREKLKAIEVRVYHEKTGVRDHRVPDRVFGYSETLNRPATLDSIMDAVMLSDADE